MWKTKPTVAICDNHQSVQAAIAALGKSGCSLENLSVLGRDCYSPGHASAEPKTCTESVSLWYKLWGMLRGDAFLNITGIGSVLVVGPLAPQLIERWANPDTDDGLDSLSAGLNSLGVSTEKIAACEAALRSDRYVLIHCGNSNEAAKAKGILEPSAHVRLRRAHRAVG